MNSNKTLFLTFLMLVIVAALYRVIPDRPFGFAPQWAIALFCGAVIKNRKWAIAFPVLSMLISDVIYEYLHAQGLSDISGFYDGQLTNYVLFTAMTVIGFSMRKITVQNVVLFSFIVCISFFLLSNFFVWASGSGYARPQNFTGLMQCYADGLPFFRNSVLSTLLFSGLLFGGYKLIVSRLKPEVNQ